MADAYPVFPWTPDYSYTEAIGFATQITIFASGVEQRRRRRTQGLRNFTLVFNLLDQDEIDAKWNFYIARSGAYGAFLYRDYPNDYRISAETPSGTINGSNDTFYMSKTYIVEDTDSSDFSPPAISPIIVVDGTTKIETTHYTIDYNTGQIVMESGHEPSSSITATYEFYFKVRFSEDIFSKELFEHIFYKTGISLKELLI